MVIPSKQGKKSHNKHNKKLDGLLLQILGMDQNQPPDTVVWKASSNDENWFEDLGSEPYAEPSPPISVFKITQPSSSVDRISGIATSSPSSLEGGGTVKVSQRFAGGTNIAFDWGTIVHKWFEDIDWFEDVPTVESLLKSAPREEAGRLGNDRVTQTANSCITALESTEIQELLTKPVGNATVYQEQDFVLRVGGGTQFAGVKMNVTTDIRGSIDRLIVHTDENEVPTSAEVIDWKTDVFESTELEEKVAHYAPQLATYRLAAASLLGLEVKSITALLVIINTGKVVDITEKAAVSTPQ